MEPELVRPLMSVGKLAKAEALFLRMVETLDASREIALHREVDLSYYQQKVAEFALLRMQLQEALEAVAHVEFRAEQHYRAAFETWKHDRRKLAGLEQAAKPVCVFGPREPH